MSKVAAAVLEAQEFAQSNFMLSKFAFSQKAFQEYGFGFRYDAAVAEFDTINGEIMDFCGDEPIVPAVMVDGIPT